MSKVIKSKLLIVHPDHAPVSQGMVVVDKGRVVGVGAEVDVPPNAEVVDCSSYTVMPALIDSHVHIALDGNPLEDIACLRQVEMVMKEGEVIADVLGGASDIFSD